MIDNSDTRQRLARIMSGTYAPKATPERPPAATYSPDEVRVQIDLVVRDMRREIIREIKNEVADQIRLATLPLMYQINDLKHEVDRVKDRLATPIDPCQEFPDLGKIIKIKVQLFNNKTNSSPKQYGKRRSGKPNFQLKLYVWTCPMREITRHIEGTCGNFYINVYQPNIAATRKRIGSNLDYLDADDAKFIGALSPTKYSNHRVWDQAAIVMPDYHLYLQVGGDRIDCGIGRGAPADWQKGAAVHVWHWRPDMTPDYGEDD
jgi:hypothetical protein